MSWEFRRAGASDLDAVMGLETAVFGDDAWSAESMRHELSSEHGYYLVAAPIGEPETVLAYAGLLAPVGSGTADIQTVAVAPGVRRHGIGRALVQALIAEARRRRARELFLEVRADNPGAFALYASLGFEEIGTRPGYYQPGDIDAIVMRLAVPDAVTTVAAPVGDGVEP